MMDKTLHQLVRKAINKDKKAFGRLCELKGRMIIYLCIREMGNPHDGQDAAQEVFIRMQRYITGLNAPEAFNTWLNRLIVTTCSNMRRSMMKTKNDLRIEEMDAPIKDESLYSLPQEFVEDASKREEIMQLVDELPEKYRSCVVMHYYEGLSYAEIAQVLDLSTSAVDNRLRMARKILKMELEEKGGPAAVTVSSIAIGPALSLIIQSAAQAAVPTETVHACLKAANVLPAAKGVLALKAGLGAKTYLQAAALVVALATVSGAIIANERRGRDADGLGAAGAVPQLAYGLSGNLYLSMDGVQDPQALNGLGDVRIELVDAQRPGEVLEQTLTAAEGGGAFSLEGTGSGRYHLRLHLPAGTRVLSPEGAELAADRYDRRLPQGQAAEGGLDESMPYLLVLDGSTTLSLGEGQELQLELAIPTPISGRVRLVGGGAQGISLEGISLEGISVTLIDPQGCLIAATKTDGTGDYVFDKPMISQSAGYTIKVEAPPRSGLSFVEDTIIIDIGPGKGYTG